MRILSRKGVVVAASVAVVLVGLSGSSWARTMKTRIHAGLKSSMHLKTAPVVMHGEEVVPGVMPNDGPDGDAAETTIPEDGKPYELRMTNAHTGESLNIIYRIGQCVYSGGAGPAELFSARPQYSGCKYVRSEGVRCAARDDVAAGTVGWRDHGDVRLPDGGDEQALRHGSARTGVAEHSQHMEGHAIDLRVPGVSTVTLRNAALSLHAGGVGYYPISQFVHVDVGPVREWVFGPRSPRVVRKRRSQVAAGM